MIEDLYHAYLEVGESPLLFWNLSIAEINDVLTSFQNRRKEEIKWQATLTKVLADQIGERIQATLYGLEQAPITPIWGFFPTLFHEEKEKMEKRNLEMQLSKYKTDWIAFAKRHNERRLGK